MAWMEALDLDPDELVRQREFLLGRADFHLESKQAGGKETLLAATLVRDAAAVSFILEETGIARQLLRRAGDLYLSQGLLYGLTLATIAGERETWRIQAERMGALRTYLALLQSAEELPIPQDVPAPFIPPSNIIWALQSLAASNRQKPPIGAQVIEDEDLWVQLNDAVSSRPLIFERSGFSPIYLKALTALSDDENIFDEGGSGILQSLRGLAAERDAEIEIARRDKFNWRMMSNPADLVDFDMTVLALAVIERGGENLLVEGLKDASGIVALPIAIAQRLRGAA